VDASCGDACRAVERVGRIFVNGEEDAAEELRSLQVSVSSLQCYKTFDVMTTRSTTYL
jgi:hypothetical protein